MPRLPRTIAELTRACEGCAKPRELLSHEAAGCSAQYMLHQLWLVLRPVAVLPAGPQQLLLTILSISSVLQPAQWLPGAHHKQQQCYLLSAFEAFRDHHAEELTA